MSFTSAIMTSILFSRKDSPEWKPNSFLNKYLIENNSLYFARHLNSVSNAQSVYRPKTSFTAEGLTVPKDWTGEQLASTLPSSSAIQHMKLLHKLKQIEQYTQSNEYIQTRDVPMPMDADEYNDEDL
uniref:U13-like protein n=1 Tax=Glypta fumiferanae TaxID=389681 RepID=A0A0F6Q742_9HYME|nr:U13-like protein [Glypta fumiferanae]